MGDATRERVENIDFPRPRSKDRVRYERATSDERIRMKRISYVNTVRVSYVTRTCTRNRVRLKNHNNNTFDITSTIEILYVMTYNSRVIHVHRYMCLKKKRQLSDKSIRPYISQIVRVARIFYGQTQKSETFICVYSVTVDKIRIFHELTDQSLSQDYTKGAISIN